MFELLLLLQVYFSTAIIIIPAWLQPYELRYYLVRCRMRLNHIFFGSAVVGRMKEIDVR